MTNFISINDQTHQLAALTFSDKETVGIGHILSKNNEITSIIVSENRKIYAMKDIRITSLGIYGNDIGINSAFRKDTLEAFLVSTARHCTNLQEDYTDYLATPSKVIEDGLGEVIPYFIDLISNHFDPDHYDW